MVLRQSISSAEWLQVFERLGRHIVLEFSRWIYIYFKKTSKKLWNSEEGNLKKLF